MLAIALYRYCIYRRNRYIEGKLEVSYTQLDFSILLLDNPRKVSSRASSPRVVLMQLITNYLIYLLYRSYVYCQYSTRLKQVQKRKTYSLTNLYQGKDTTAERLELQEGVLIKPTLGGAGSILIRRRIVASNLIIVIVEDSKALDKVISSSKSSSPELILILALVVLGVYIRSISSYIGGQEREYRQLNYNVGVAPSSIVGVLLLKGTKGSIIVEGYISSQQYPYQ